MIIWGIFTSYEDREETIHDSDKCNGEFFTTEELALTYLNSLKKWWYDFYKDPCITEAAKQEFFGNKTPDESIRLFNEPDEIIGHEDMWVLTRDCLSSIGAEMRERIVARELYVHD